jgi:hypothetical protein
MNIYNLLKKIINFEKRIFSLIFLLSDIVLVRELMASLCKFRTINMQTITLTCATSAAYASHFPTAPCNQLMAQRQLSWNPTALC